MSLFRWPPSVDIFNILPGFPRQPLLRHQRLLTCKQMSSLERSSLQLKLCCLDHRSLRSLQLPPQLMFWLSMLLLRFQSHSLPSPSDAVHSEPSHVEQVSFLVLFFTRHFVPRSPFGRRAVRQREYGLRLLIFKMANNKVDLGQIRSEEIVYNRFIKIPLG